MTMESVQEKRLQKLPQAARMEIGQIVGDKRYVSAAAARKQAIKATAREYTVLDPQMLLDDFELQQTAWGDRGDALNQMPSPIYAPNLFANAGLVTFRSQRAGQECPQQEWRNIGNLLVKQHAVPNNLGLGFKVHAGGDGFAHCFAREKP